MCPDPVAIAALVIIGATFVLSGPLYPTLGSAFAVEGGFTASITATALAFFAHSTSFSAPRPADLDLVRKYPLGTATPAPTLEGTRGGDFGVGGTY